MADNAESAVKKEPISSQELELVEKVFLKFVIAETDEKLQKSFETFLAPVLLKLGSNSEAVRSKVIELLTHINKRLKSRPKIKLPVEALLKQYEDPNTSQFVTNFTMIYIKMGFSRLELIEQLRLLPRIFDCMKERPKQQQETFLCLVSPLLNNLELPDDIEKKKKILTFQSDKQLSSLFLDFVMDFLFLPYSNDPTSSDNQPLETSTCPPGLSNLAFQRFKFEPTLTSAQVENVKLGILKVLGSDVFPGPEVVVHFVISTGDVKHSVADKGEHCLKKFSSSPDWENNEIVDKLFKIFQGTVLGPGNPRQAVTVDLVRSPASMRLKLKIFPYLLRSRTATNRNPAAAIKIIFESLFGEATNSRMKKFAIDFCHHICQFGSEKTLSFVAPLLYQAFIKIISNKKEETKLRSLCYAGLGKLSKRNGGIFKRDIGLVQSLFIALEEEEKEVILSVQEALSMIAPTYWNITGTDANLMEALILSNLDKESSLSRLAALQFANAVFPATHASSRYSCLLASLDKKDDVREEAKRGLQPNYDDVTDSEKSIGKYPSFLEMCDYLYSKVTSRLNGASESTLAFPGPIFEKVLAYLRRCLHASSGVTKQQLTTGDVLQPTAQYLISLLKDIDAVELSCIARYVVILRNSLLPTADANLHTIALESLLELSAALPRQIFEIFKDDIHLIKSFMHSAKEEARICAAKVLSIISESMEEKDFIQQIKEMIGDVENKNFDIQHGSLFGLAFFISRRFSDKPDYINDDCDDPKSDYQNDLKDLVKEATAAIAFRLASENPLLRLASCHALGELGRCISLPLDSSSDEIVQMPEKKIKTEKPDDVIVTKDFITTQMIALLDSKDTKTKERAALSLGYLIVGDPNFLNKEKVLEALYSTAKARQLEFNFTVGEALSCIGAGLSSSAARDKWRMHPERGMSAKESQPSSLGEILKTVVGKYVTSTATCDKQAASIWLLSIVKFSPDHPEIKKMLKEIQAAFMELLTSSDEITQDVASRGISLVYEQVEDETKDQLVSILVERLTTGKRPAPKVDGNTQLFKGASLGSTPDGSSLSTYKELCSLASSLNQPDLVYKFMNLAKHSAIWNSRKGAAFGFLGIASQAKKQLEPFLPELIPKLYRYQYDPNPDVQKAMSNIWSAVVPQDKKSLDKYLKIIAKDLIENMVNYQWRVRESSCIALSDLIRSAPAEDIVDSLPEIWETNFKVLDDIKESVRNSATISCKTVSKVTVRICDVTQSKVGEKAISLVLPVLLNVGLASKVDAVKAMSLQTLVQISKSAGKLLKPHISKLVISLLEYLSGLEPQYLNTLNLQLSRSKDAQDRLDAIRVSASKSSPMMDTINMCVQYVDPGVLMEVVPKLCDLIKTGIGLGTKVGCANFVISLTLHCRNELLPFSGKLLASLVNGLSTQNKTVKKSYANAIGNLVMFSKPSSIEKLAEKLKGWYLEKEDYSRQMAVAWTFHAMSRYSPDVLKSHSTAILPVVFLAMHQEVSKDDDDSDENATKEIKDVWEDIWQCSTPGTTSGIKLHIQEIFDLLTPTLGSQSWKLKAQAAKSIGTIAESLGASLSQPYLGKLLAILIESLPGRMWNGKEQLLKSLSSTCLKCKDVIEKCYITESSCPNIDLIINGLLKECKKGNATYKMIALDSVSDILEAYQKDRLTNIIEIVNKYLKKKDKKDDENDDDIDDRSIKDALVSCCVNSIGKAWPSNEATQELHFAYVLEAFTRMLNSSVWRVQLAILRSSKSFFKRLHWGKAVNKWTLDGNTPFANYVFEQYLNEVFTCTDHTVHSSVRLQGLNLLSTLLESSKVSMDIQNDESFIERFKSLALKYKDSTHFDISQASASILELI